MLPLESVLTDYLDLTDYSDRIDKARLKKWANVQLQKLPYVDHMLHKIKLLEVKNGKAERPSDLEMVIQVAFNEDETVRIKRKEVVEYTLGAFDGSGCEFKITKECPSCHQDSCSCDSPEIIIDVDELIDRSHPEWRYQHMAHFYKVGGLGKGYGISSIYHPSFKIIGLGDKGSFNQAGLHITGCISLRKDLACQDCTKYTIEPNHIQVNKKDGQLLISYLAYDLDEDGYRKVPDVPEVFDALTWFLEERMSYLSWKKTRDRNDLLDSQAAEAKKLMYMGIAREKLNTQDFASFQRDLGKFYAKILPSEDSCGNVTDMYHSIMGRLTNLG